MRMLFSCGNPFKAQFAKRNNASISPHLHLSLFKFERNLRTSITKLVPKDDDKNDFFTVSWMIQAMQSLCETHKSITTIMTTHIDLPLPDTEEGLIDMYVDFTSKLLELFNGITSELYRINHGNLLLKDALSKPGDFSVSHIKRWRQHTLSNNPSMENCDEVLSDLVKYMNEHYHGLHKNEKKKKKKKKNEEYTKEELLVRALYGVEVKTLYIFSVFNALLTTSSICLLNLTIPEEMEEAPWGQAYMELQNVINPEFRKTFLSYRFACTIRDFEAVEAGVEKLDAAFKEGRDPSLLVVEPLKQLVIELSERFDLVSKETNCLLDLIISAREALCERLWTKNKSE